MTSVWLTKAIPALGGVVGKRAILSRLACLCDTQSTQALNSANFPTGFLMFLSPLRVRVSNNVAYCAGTGRLTT